MSLYRAAAGRYIPRASSMSRNNVRALSTAAPKQQQPDAGPVADNSVGPMYRYQNSLANLPVPPVAETAAKFLESTKALLTADEFNKTEKAVQEFVSDPVVSQLQNRLQERASQEDNWIYQWWNDAAYFGVRDPNVPGVNYFYVHKDDKFCRTGPKRAALLIRSLLYFKQLVETEKLEPEMMKSTPLCMSSYKWLFNSSKIPQKDKDTAIKYDPSQNKHIVVIRNNKFYSLPVIDDKGNFLSAADMEMQFMRIVDMAGSEAHPHPVGALTAQNRDTWAQARAELIKDPQNAKSLETIQSAIIVVALDAEKPVTRSDLSWGLWVGDGKNRFFDKHQLIVYDNGRSGSNNEHSCMDGTPTSRLNEFLIRSIAENKIDLGSPTPRPDAVLAPEPLEFNLNQTNKQDIESAVKYHQDIMAQHKLSVLYFEAYGKNGIKKIKTGPDSWAQLAMQLAYYKMCGKLAGTYESAQVRKFKKGRTEVIRTATQQALDWCKAMEDPNSTNATRLQLFRKAANAHVTYAGMAADGKGVDRHLFGLKKLLKEGEQVPALYSSPGFSKSGHWTLSTSNLSSPMISNWGFGQVVEDGYGLGYSVHDNSLRWTITSLTRNTKHFKQYLEESLVEMMDVMKAAMEEGEIKSKA